MKTTSKEKIAKARELKVIIEKRRELEKLESQLKDFFKEEITDGVLIAEEIVITIEEKERSSYDGKALKVELGDKHDEFVKVTKYKQVNVK